MNLSLQRLSRIPGRLSDDLKIVTLVRNWPELLKAKLDQTPVGRIELRNGVVLESPPEMDLNFLFHEIWLDEMYAPSGYALEEGDVVVDIGGNIGVFATYAATRAKGVSVHSFEPFPKNAEFFLSNVERSRLKNVELEEVAVAGTTEPRRLHVANSWGCHSLVEDQVAKDASAIEVSCTTLDRIISKTGRCDFLKVDCEGGEYEILMSASPETLGRLRRMVLEYHDSDQGTGARLKSFLEDRGFRIDVFHGLDSTTGVLCATNPNYVGNE